MMQDISCKYLKRHKKLSIEVFAFIAVIFQYCLKTNGELLYFEETFRINIILLEETFFDTNIQLYQR